MFGETDKKKIAEEKARIEKEVKAIAELGQKCLSTPDFIKYKEKLAKLKKQAWRLLVDFPNPDPVQDAFYTRVLINKIDVLSLLVEEVEKDANKKLPL